MLNNLSKWLLFYLLAAAFAFLVYLLIPRNSLQAYDQPKGEAIKVSRVTLDKDGFILVSSYEDPFQPGTVLGRSELLPAGIYNNLNIPLTESAVTLDRVLITVYKDNGDGFLNAEAFSDLSAADEPVRGINGAIIKKVVKVY